MTTDKEELRKEFVEELRKGITFAGQIGDYVINQSLFDWLNSKLEAKDKEIAELKCDKERLTKACNYIQSSRNELDQQITDLKAEIEKIKMDADSVARDALQKYNEFLLKHGYTDTDIISEEPTAIDQFLKIYLRKAPCIPLVTWIKQKRSIKQRKN